MSRFLKKRNEKLGLAPGALVFVGDQRVQDVTLDVIQFDPEHFEERKVKGTSELVELHQYKGVTWLNVTGLHDPSIVKDIGTFYELHPLLLEDIMNTSQRPKFEEFANSLFLVLKMLHIDTEKDALEAEQVSLIVVKNTLISFQEIPEDVFDPIRERLRHPTTKIRHRGSDYLAFALIDGIVDRYVEIIENFGERIEDLENELMTRQSKSHFSVIHKYKQEINFLRKSIRPAREMVVQYRRSESVLLEEQTLPFLKDLEDHITQATEAIEIYKEMLNDLMNIYNSNLNNRLNDIIRVLTIFSVVFIPLTFIAGIYGTNFEYFPELGYRYAYPVFWGVLICTALGMIYFFKKRKWL